MNRQIIHNAMRTPDGTVLVSRDRHDYVTHVDATNGKEYMLDGGDDYVRCSTHPDQEFLTVYMDDPHEKRREVFTWGTYGKDGKGPLRLVPLKDLSTAHIEAILATQVQIRGTYVQSLMEDELAYRDDKDIVCGQTGTSSEECQCEECRHLRWVNSYPWLDPLPEDVPLEWVYELFTVRLKVEQEYTDDE